MDEASSQQAPDTAGTDIPLRDHPAPPWQGLLIGLACGAVVFAIMQAVHPLFRVPERFHIAGIGAPPAQHVAFRREQDRLDRQHAMLYLAALGLLAGGTLGLRRAKRGKRWTVLASSLLGAAGGAAGGALAPLMYVYARDKIGQIELLQIIEAQLLIGIPMGLLIGLGVGLAGNAASGAIKGLFAGAAGGALFAILYPLTVAVLIPAANAEVLLPEEAVTRLAWLATLGGSVGLTACFNR